MTTAERLVRNLCEDARRRITAARLTELDAVPTAVALTDVPGAVRQAIATIKRWQPKVRAAERVITAAGFEAPTEEWCRCDDPRKSRTALSRGFRWQEDRKTAIRTRHQTRTAAVEALQNAANVAVLGKTAAEAQDVLIKLQTDLGKV